MDNYCCSSLLDNYYEYQIEFFIHSSLNTLAIITVLYHNEFPLIAKELFSPV